MADRTLDLSFNLLRRIPAEPLSTMTSLHTLYLIQNKISHIEGLEPLAPTLTSLELGGNKLRVRSRLSSCTRPQAQLRHRRSKELIR